MTRRSYILVLLLTALIAFPSLLLAVDEPARVTWRKKVNSRSGLYTTKNYFVSNGVSLSVNALYYFGDADNEGLAVVTGFNPENLGISGALGVNYNMPVSNHVNLRFSLMGGMLRGNNTELIKRLEEPRYDYRKFQSIFAQPAFGVQYYPFNGIGLYLYGGVAITASYITHFEFAYYTREAGSGAKVLDVASGKTVGFLPMAQIGLGYTWRLADSWDMSAEFMIQEGLIDMRYLNLDAYPLAAAQNDKGIELGRDVGPWIGKGGKLNPRWNDGWFQLGITVTYRWRNCENCRILNNYSGIKGRRR